MTENCCLRPYTPLACEGGVDFGANETLSCVLKGRCQNCMMSIGFSDDGCLRCCALSRTPCTYSGFENSATSGVTAWAVAVMSVIGVCVVFTLVYVLTSKRRNEGMAFQAHTSNAYFVALPSATRGGNMGAATSGDDSDDETPVSDSAFLVGKSESDDSVVPVARRTVPPVVGVRRPLTVAQASQNIFFLDTQGAAAAADARESSALPDRNRRS